jgi:acetyl-CoA carboxylase biotin carboxyl carrier protein
VELDRERIQEVIEFLKQSSVAEIAVGDADLYVRVARFMAPAEAAAAVAAASGAAVEAAVALEEAAPTTTVQARVVGLFYRGKRPGDAPLVEVGDTVAEGQPLGIIEVLRKPTEITSPVAGEIIEITHEEGSGVQYSDPLFVIRPS